MLAAALLSLVAVAGCGASGDESQDEALAALRLTAEAAGLQSEMGKLVGSLSSEPSAAERRSAQRRLVSLDQRAAQLIASAEADSTYEVELRPLNGSLAIGVATLVESEGRVAIDAAFRGVQGGGRHPVAIHALGPGQGRSVCPPADAAAGADRTLSASEAEDFYGRPALLFGSVAGSGRRVSLTTSRPAGASAPLDVRVLVLGGRLAAGRFRPDIPVACGIPTISARGAEPSSSSELVIAVNQTRAAGVALATVVDDPTSARASLAGRRADGQLDAAVGHLRKANQIAVGELEEGGEVSDEARQAARQAAVSIGGSQIVVSRGFGALKTKVAQERREQRRRLAQRQEAVREVQESAEAGAEPASEAAPEPEPEYAPEPAPEAAPEPAPASPQGPTIPHPE